MDLRLAVRRVVQKVQKDGFWTTAAESVRVVLRPRDQVSAFDAQFGTETSLHVPLWKLKLESPNAVYGTKYQASDEQEIRDGIAAVPADPEEMVFIDVGCGKGIAVLVAAQLGFKRVIGVEFASELVRIACENTARTNVSAEIVETDAAGYEFPNEDMIVYLYNPFQQQVMEKVIENLKQVTAKRVFVVYNVPNCAFLFDQAGFERIGSPAKRPYVQVWRKPDGSFEHDVRVPRPECP